MDPTESGVIESSGGGPDRTESNSGGPDIIGSGPDRTGSDHDGPDKSVIIPLFFNKKKKITIEVSIYENLTDGG
jgi:hypothetical protein